MCSYPEPIAILCSSCTAKAGVLSAHGRSEAGSTGSKKDETSRPADDDDAKTVFCWPILERNPERKSNL